VRSALPTRHVRKVLASPEREKRKRTPRRDKARLAHEGPLEGVLFTIFIQWEKKRKGEKKTEFNAAKKNEITRAAVRWRRRKSSGRKRGIVITNNSGGVRNHHTKKKRKSEAVT